MRTTHCPRCKARISAYLVHSCPKWTAKRIDGTAYDYSGPASTDFDSSSYIDTSYSSSDNDGGSSAVGDF